MYAGYGMPRRARTTIDGYMTYGVFTPGRRLGGLAGESNCIGYCKKCNGPCFRQSKNVDVLTSMNTDNTPRLKHFRCPKRAAR